MWIQVNNVLLNSDNIAYISAYEVPEEGKTNLDFAFIKGNCISRTIDHKNNRRMQEILSEIYIALDSNKNFTIC